MSDRPITFPKTADGEWVNRETGVKITRYGKGYRAFRPADVTGEYIGIGLDVKSLDLARSAAKVYVHDVARPEIGRAYDEALAEHIEYTRQRAEGAGVDQWRVDAARRMYGYGQGWHKAVLSDLERVEQTVARVDALARAAAEESVRGCSYTGDDWSEPHAYEYDPTVIVRRIESGDETTRCGMLPGDDRHHDAAVDAVDRAVRFAAVYKVGSRYHTGWVAGTSGSTGEILVREPDGTETWRTADHPPKGVSIDDVRRDVQDQTLLTRAYMTQAYSDARPTRSHTGAMIAGEAAVVAEDEAEAHEINDGRRAMWPEGTVQYDRYAAALRNELAKFADGQDPYPYTSWHRDGKLTTPTPGDIVRINRQGADGGHMRWRVVSFDADRKRVQLDLVRGSLLGPQWENWCDVDLVHRPDEPGRSTWAEPPRGYEHKPLMPPVDQAVPVGDLEPFAAKVDEIRSQVRARQITFGVGCRMLMTEVGVTFMGAASLLGARSTAELA